MNKTNILKELKTKPNLEKRFLAGLIDYIIIGTFFFVFVYTFGKPNSDGGYSLEGSLGLIPILFWGIMTIGLEQWIGSTLGNSIVGLKPISISGIKKKPTFSQSLKRHLLDPIDMSFLGIVGILTIKSTQKNQRLGDLWAKTIVIAINENKNKTYVNIG